MLVPDLTDLKTAYDAAQNGQTSPGDLAFIAQYHPGLRYLVAGHANAFPTLLEWIDQFDDPEVAQAGASARAA